MRLLHEVSPEETLVCRGQYHYLKDGAPTGQTETWQISMLPSGETIVRADIDGGKSANPVNLLAHLQRNGGGRPDWLRMRYERGDFVAAAQYTFHRATVTVARQAEDHPRRQETIDIAENYEVDFHAVIAHDYVWRGYPRHARGRSWAVPVISPDLWVDGYDVLGGRVMRFNVQPRDNENCTVPAGTFEDVRHFDIILSDGITAQAWYDDLGIPLRWYYPEKNFDFQLLSYLRELEAEA